MGRRVDEFDPSARHRAFKMQYILVIVIADQEAQGFTERGGLPHLLREPGIGWSPCHADMHHSSRAMLDDEEQKHGAEEQVEGLDEVTCPNLAGMVGQEGCPALA